MNLLLATDVYKMGHMEQYPPGTTEIYSYLTARSSKLSPEVTFYGLQYYLRKLAENPPTLENVDEFLDYRQSILGGAESQKVRDGLVAFAKLGYIPLRIKAIAEGTTLPVQNALMTMVNTDPRFPWVVGFFESLLLKAWNTCTVASYSRKLRQLCEMYAEITCDDNTHVDYQVHDFGYRGCSSEETAALSGSAHLVHFKGTDTIPALHLINQTYGVGAWGASVPASEHSVMCSFGRLNEMRAFEHMLDTYPTGIVSIVSDTYDFWKVLTEYLPTLKSRIMKRDGKVVIRPDSGDPLKIICGDKSAPSSTPENRGALEMLGELFGTSRNSKGRKVLNPKIGLIYGDGFYYQRFEQVLATMAVNGWASSNLVVGIGGLLLQQHSRDDMGFAIKATHAVIDGQDVELYKDPATDVRKRSKTGLLRVRKNSEGVYYTDQKVSRKMEAQGELQLVFENGKMFNQTIFPEIRKRALLE